MTFEFQGFSFNFLPSPSYKIVLQGAQCPGDLEATQATTAPQRSPETQAPAQVSGGLVGQEGRYCPLAVAGARLWREIPLLQGLGKGRTGRGPGVPLLPQTFRLSHHHPSPQCPVHSSYRRLEQGFFFNFFLEIISSFQKICKNEKSRNGTLVHPLLR